MNAVLGFIDIEKCYPQIEREQVKKTGLALFAERRMRVNRVQRVRSAMRN